MAGCIISTFGEDKLMPLTEYGGTLLLGGRTGDWLYAMLAIDIAGWVWMWGSGEASRYTSVGGAAVWAVGCPSDSDKAPV
jgi:hypothetical protein